MARSGAPQQFHSSAKRAIMPNIRGLADPTTIGTSPTGFGSQGASVTSKCVPANVVRGSCSSDRTIWIASPKRVTRGPGRQQVDAVGVVLVDLPAGAETEHEAAVADPVDRRRPVGEQRRVVHRGRRDQRADPDRRRGRGEGPEDGPALVVRPVGDLLGAGVRHVVVGQPDAVPAVALRPLGELEHFCPRAVGRGPGGELHPPDRTVRRRTLAGLRRRLTRSARAVPDRVPASLSDRPTRRRPLPPHRHGAA